MKPILIVSCIQSDFFDKGAFPIKNAEKILPIINDLRSKYDKKFLSVYITQQYRPPTHISFVDSPYAKEENLPFDEATLASKGKFPRHCVQESQGANFHPEMVLNGKEVLIRFNEDKFKEELSAFSNPTLIDVLKVQNPTDIFIVGISFEFNVGFTAIDSVKNGFNTYIIKEGTAPVAEASAKEMEKNLEMNKVKVISLKEFEELMEKVPDVPKEEVAQ